MNQRHETSAASPLAGLRPAALAGAGGLRLARLRQHFPRPLVHDVPGTVWRQMECSGVRFAVGSDVAVAVGSRGIANLPELVRSVVSFIAAQRARPFVVPAMGSHGGATAEGQSALLAALGVTESAVGCPIRSGMDVVSLPADGLGHGLFMDARAAAAHGIVLINRIKPHTDFHGRHESGLAKMAVIGLGKERQAFEMHRFGAAGLRKLVPEAAVRVLATGKILLGLGVVENAYDETALIEAIPPHDLMDREAALLDIARQNMPRLPVDELDLLIVDQLGKDISGTGMDTNVIGRMRIETEPEPAAPCVRSLVVTGLTPGSHGNATGIGLADVITARLVADTDFGVTYTNIVTSGFLERAKMPIVAATDRDAVAIALRGLGVIEPGRERIARIRDTLHLSELWVSAAVVEEVRGREGIEVCGEPEPAFGEDDALRPIDGRGAARTAA